MSCIGCEFHQMDRLLGVLLCNVTPNDVCPIVEDLDNEVVAPCPKCGRDCDGCGVVDGIPVCPKCDEGVL